MHCQFQYFADITMLVIFCNKMITYKLTVSY